MISIIDYDQGNVFSIGMALQKLGAEYVVANDVAAVRQAKKIILPGVGSFPTAMSCLRKKDLVGILVDSAVKGIPILGICLGMQLMATLGEEFEVTEGFDLIPGYVRSLSKGGQTRIPNVGWRRLKVSQGQPGDFQFLEGTMMYFVHSFAMFPNESHDIVATINVNDEDIVAMVRRKNLLGCQFHPEKSGEAGLKVIHSFINNF